MLRAGTKNNTLLALAVVLAALAILATMLAPGFQIDNGLVYGGF